MKIALGLIVSSYLCLFCASAEEHRSLEATSKNGIKGVTVATVRHSKGGWMNSALVLTGPGTSTKEFRISRAFIERWGFTDADKSVVIRSRNAHGPSWLAKYDIASGNLIAECSGSEEPKDTPEWARPFCDQSEISSGK